MARYSTRLTPADRKARDRVTAAYSIVGNGVQIDIMDIPKVYDAGLEAIANGADAAALRSELALFLDSIRKN